MHRLIALIAAATPLLLAQGGSAGSIEGTVVDENGKPVTGAFVTVIRDFLSPGAPAAPYSQNVTTGANGSYSVQGLLPGTYSYCAQIPGDGYLNGCYWTNPLPKVTVSEGEKATSANRIAMVKGSVVKIRLQDAGNQAGQKTKDGKNPPIRLGVWDNRGRFLPAHAAGRDNDGWDYQLTIPFDTDLKLQVLSRDLKLADSAGEPLAASKQTTLRQNSSDPNPKSFRFNVTGVNP